MHSQAATHGDPIGVSGSWRVKETTMGMVLEDSGRAQLGDEPGLDEPVRERAADHDDPRAVSASLVPPRLDGRGDRANLVLRWLLGAAC